MKTLRKQLINWLFEISSKIYTQLFKDHKPWRITKKELLGYTKDSFGYHLGLFLDKNNFELIPKVERHDCFHVLTNYSTKVEDEIALQYLSLGNGKNSPYLFGAIILGTIILPDYLTYYIKSYKIGKQVNVFHNLDFRPLLKVNIEQFREAIFTKKQIQTLKKLHCEQI
ncbi:Coq4 family protein [uncultured Lacinutrix sp.]|uniref:Coq4 family protein n=1 Tax=uncultured Lacinutrix sp. TaxID=574032 RepID=UPI002636775B|nr:Coq4 family protein [uncultured Lacinutrix sp.]